MKSVVIFCGAVLLVLVCLMDLIARKKRRNAESSGTGISVPEESSQCCGKHAVCEKQRLADAMSKRAVYFDDEELDRFTGRSSDGYTDEEAEEFRYVMYTMKPDEVQEWIESLQVRSIEMPDQLKDEALMLIG